QRGAPAETVNAEAQRLQATAQRFGADLSVSSDDATLDRVARGTKLMAQAVASGEVTDATPYAIVRAAREMYGPDEVVSRSAAILQQVRSGGAEQTRQSMELLGETAARLQALRANMQANLPEGATSNTGQPAAQITPDRGAG